MRVAVAGHQPHGLASLPALDDRQAEHAGVERLGRFQVDDLEDELADAGDRDPGYVLVSSAASASGTVARTSSRRMKTSDTSRATAAKTTITM